MDSRLKKLLYVLIIVNILASAWYAFHRDIVFHTDIARDFLLVSDVVDNHHITLIGPRSGGVSGVFHGPLWIYLQVPAYIIGHGSPAAVGTFWVMLSILSIGILYWVAKKVFNEQVAIVSSLLLSSYSILYTNNLFNPFGAVLLSPLFLYLFWKFTNTVNWRHLLGSLFVLGVIIQFQMAFGVPILILATLYLIYFLHAKKKLPYFAAYFILLIPLSTYIMFELKHQFLQIHSVINYFAHPPSYTRVKFLPYAWSRIKGYLFDGTGLSIGSYWPLMVPIVAIFIYYFLNRSQKINRDQKKFYFLFFYFYTGFWMVTLPYKDVIWNYYYWPFLPLSVLLVAAAYIFIPKKIYVSIIAVLYLLSIAVGVQSIADYRVNRTKDASTWVYYHDVAQKIFQDAPSEFGYYIYTPDLFGYSYRYAMNYTQKEFPAKKAYPFQKKSITYLLIAPPPADRLFLKGDWWRGHQVNINKKPQQTFVYPSGFIVEKYELTDSEQKVPSDPNLIQDIHFR